MVDASQSHAGDKPVDVGNQIRLLRRQRQLSQQALSEASGVSRNALSLIERGQTSPTVNTLKSLADALSVDINAFFQPFDEASIVFTKAEQRPHLLLDHGTLADLGLGMPEQSVTPLFLELEPAARSGPAITHEGQDFIFCLTGEILYLVNGQGFIMEAGDSLFFDGRLPHRFRNAGIETARVLIILSAPHDVAQYMAGHFSNNFQAGNHDDPAGAK